MKLKFGDVMKNIFSRVNKSSKISFKILTACAVFFTTKTKYPKYTA
jgi:hypothetical protein